MAWCQAASRERSSKSRSAVTEATAVAEISARTFRPYMTLKSKKAVRWEVEERESGLKQRHVAGGAEEPAHPGYSGHGYEDEGQSHWVYEEGELAITRALDATPGGPNQPEADDHEGGHNKYALGLTH